MSQVSPGWYPDPSGRFVQRYHDGTRWTEHVADANGNRATDMPETQARPASYQQGGYGQQGPERRYDREADGGWDPRHVGEAAGVWPAADDDRSRRGARRPAQPGQPRAEGWPGEPAAASAGDQPWSGAQAGGEDRPGAGAVRQAGGPARAQGGATAQPPGSTGGGGWRPAGAAGRSPRTGAARGHDVGQGYGSLPGHGQQPTYGQPTYGQPNDAYGAPPASAGGFTPTLGLIVGVVGGLLVLLSLFGLDFLEFSFPGFSETISLADVAGDFNEDAPFAIDTYASFGRFLAVLVIVGAVLAAGRVVPLFQEVPVPIIVAAVCGAFALWHVLAMLSSAEGVDVSPTFGAILGLLGYVGLAAGPFLKQPLGAIGAAGAER